MVSGMPVLQGRAQVGVVGYRNGAINQMRYGGSDLYPNWIHYLLYGVVQANGRG